MLLFCIGCSFLLRPISVIRKHSVKPLLHDRDSMIWKVQGNGLILAFSVLAMVVVVGKLTDIIFIISLFRPPFPALAILCAHFGRWLAFQPPPHRRVCRRLLLHCNLRKNAFSKCTIVMAETEAALDFYGIKVDPILCSSWKEPLTSFSDKFEAILACLWPYLFHRWRRRPSVLPFIFPFISVL